MENLFYASWVSGLSIAASIYISRFNDLSEAELVRWSYVWLPLIIFGVIGHIIQKNGIADGIDDPFNTALLSAAKSTVVGMAILIVFYEAVWPEL